MSVGDWVALYAAVVATTALVAQIVSRLRDRRESLRLELGMVLMVDTVAAAESLTSSDTFKAQLDSIAWQVTLMVTNFSTGPVHVSDASINARRPHHIDKWALVESWALPWRLEPGEARTIMLTNENASELVGADSIEGIVHTTRKKEFRTAPLLLQLGADTDGRLLIGMAGSAFRQLVSEGDPAARYFMMRVHETDDRPDNNTERPS